jgi:hypothetical protein
MITEQQTIAVIAAAVIATAATVGFIFTMLAYAQNITIGKITAPLPQDFMEQIIEEARKPGEVDRLAD